jgi:hypothetical protein
LCVARPMWNAEDHKGNTPLHVMAGSWSYGLNPHQEKVLHVDMCFFTC